MKNVDIGPSKTISIKKEIYIEYLRAAATLAVIFLHINMTVVANYLPNEMGILNYVIFNDCYILVKWAVPCFVMISGALLLNPQKKVDYKRIGKYITRMIIVLLTFGIVYAYMELIFSEKSVTFDMIFRASLNMLEGESWSHMWYIYTLIGLYLVTMPLRYVVEKVTMRELEIIILTLILGNFLIPSLNTILGITLENYMLISEYIVWYILGYYIAISERNFIRYAILGVFTSVIFMIVSENLSIYYTATSFPLNHQTKNIFTLILGISIFSIAKEIGKIKKLKYGRICKFICANSFAIYLVHPIFINIIYKVFLITPLSFPTGFGIIILSLIVFILSLMTSLLLRRCPLIKKII